MLNEGKLKGISLDDNMGQLECFNQILSAKQNMTISDLCGQFQHSQSLKCFFEHIFSLQFKEKPDYDRLKSLIKQFYNELDLKTL